MNPIVQNFGSTIGLILLAVAAASAVELIIPLRARGRWARAHFAPNLVLTFITFAISALLNTGVVLLLVWLQARGLGVLNARQLNPVLATVLMLLALDFAFYVAHVAMHKVPALWRFHRVHHSDPQRGCHDDDSTTTGRERLPLRVHRGDAWASRSSPCRETLGRRLTSW